MSDIKKDAVESPVMIEDSGKHDLYSISSGVGSGVNEGAVHVPTVKLLDSPRTRLAPVKGIDAEVANFFAEQTNATKVVIDEKENKRLRWMVHKRVLTVMVCHPVVSSLHLYSPTYVY